MVDYSELEIAAYDYWTLFLHKNQHYLGRTYLWAKRKDDISLAGTSKEEWFEFFRLASVIEGALNDLFNPLCFEYHQMGNEEPHLHVHIIPRYESYRTFDNIRFADKNWPNQYAPYNKNFKIPEETIRKLIDAIKEKLE